MPLSLLLLAFLSFSPARAQAESCREIRAALDIGSGSAKAYAAGVNLCEKKLLETVYEEDIPFPCNEALEKAPGGILPPSFLEENAPRLASIAQSARARGAVSLVAYATSCLRKAANGAAIAADLGKRIGVPVRIISQEKEAELGFLSAMAAHRVSAEELPKVVVWDIGGGSMQMEAATIGENQEYKGSLAAVSFKNRIIKEIQKKNPAEVSSPNPIGPAWPRAVRMAEEHAQRTLPAFFKQIKNQRRWLGIGGALALSTQEQIKEGARSFTRAELEAALKKRAFYNDEEIGGAYRITQVSNLALVLGYMKALGINKVETARASLNQGALSQEIFRAGRSAPPATAAPSLPLKPAVKEATKPAAPMGQ